VTDIAARLYEIENDLMPRRFVPQLVAALRAVLAACDELSIESPNNTRYVRADEILALIAAALVSA